MASDRLPQFPVPRRFSEGRLAAVHRLLSGPHTPLDFVHHGISRERATSSRPFRRYGHAPGKPGRGFCLSESHGCGGRREQENVKRFMLDRSDFQGKASHSWYRPDACAQNRRDTRILAQNKARLSVPQFSQLRKMASLIPCLR